MAVRTRTPSRLVRIASSRCSISCRRIVAGRLTGKWGLGRFSYVCVAAAQCLVRVVVSIKAKLGTLFKLLPRLGRNPGHATDNVYSEHQFRQSPPRYMMLSKGDDGTASKRIKPIGGCCWREDDALIEGERLLSWAAGAFVFQSANWRHSTPINQYPPVFSPLRYASTFSGVMVITIPPPPGSVLEFNCL